MPPPHPESNPTKNNSRRIVTLQSLLNRTWIETICPQLVPWISKKKKKKSVDRCNTKDVLWMKSFFSFKRYKIYTIHGWMDEINLTKIRALKRVLILNAVTENIVYPSFIILKELCIKSNLWAKLREIYNGSDSFGLTVDMKSVFVEKGESGPQSGALGLNPSHWPRTPSDTAKKAGQSQRRDGQPLLPCQPSSPSASCSVFPCIS